MHRKIVAILLILAFTAHNFNRAFIMLDYYANTSSFAKNCENKARPMMHCNGKCQMMKKLQEEENKDQKNSTGKGENKDEAVYIKTAFAGLACFNRSIALSFSDYAHASFAKGMHPDIFHPPAV